MSGLFDELDLWNVTEFEAEMAKIRQGNPQNLVIRRRVSGVETVLPEQEFRIAENSATGSVDLPANAQARQWRIRVTLLGKPTADIQSNDRFTYQGALYTVLSGLTRNELGVRAEAILENNF